MWTSLLLGLVSLLTDMSSEMTYPLLPLLVATLLGVLASTAGLIVGVVEGLAESTASLLKVVSVRRAGTTSRRKPFTIAGYAGSTLMCPPPRADRPIAGLSSVLRPSPWQPASAGAACSSWPPTAANRCGTRGRCDRSNPTCRVSRP